jgi:hypothetical protein
LNNIDWIFLNSIFISSFSLFEVQLYKITNIVEYELNLNIKVKDINGKGIYQYRKYLDLVASIQIAKKNKPWLEIDKYQKVRNKLVHNGGLIITDPSKTDQLEKDEIYKFLKSKNVHVLGSLGRIRIKNLKLINDFTALTIKISDDLIEEIKSK